MFDIFKVCYCLHSIIENMKLLDLFLCCINIII